MYTLLLVYTGLRFQGTKCVLIGDVLVKYCIKSVERLFNKLRFEDKMYTTKFVFKQNVIIVLSNMDLGNLFPIVHTQPYYDC